MQKKIDLNLNKSTNEVINTLDITGFKSNCPDKVRPFLRYPGSKFNASKYIEPFWRNISHTEYREPFLGSGAIFFKKPKSKFSYLNDLDKELINSFEVVSEPSSRSKLINKLHNINPSKTYFNSLKQSTPVSNVDRAFKYFVINRMAYSGIMKLPNWGFHPTKSVQPSKWPARLIDSGKKLESNVSISSLHFSEIINKPSKNTVWMFIDPPYYKADQKRAYNHYFTAADHLLLNQNLQHTPHKFCLTYDDCPEIRELYSWANIHVVEWMYHTANSKVATRKKGKELIITNY